MTAKLMASLRAAPATVPQLAAVALFVVWATAQAGYPVTHWAPGGLVVVVLLVLALAAVRPRGLPLGLRVALAALAAYTALSYLSILWAGSPGDAWEGANRTLLYLLVFALFACWRQDSRSAALVLVIWVLAMVGLAAYVLLHADSVSAAGLPALFPSGRLVDPTGYPNANAAQWLMVFWPAALLARSERLPWALRGVLAGGAVLLAEVALLSQSRGSLYATPVMLVLVFALLPRRLRTFALLIPVAGAIAAAAPAVLRVGDHLRQGQVTTGNLHSATTATLLAALAAGLLVAAAAALESRVKVPAGTRRQLRLGLAAVAGVALLALVVGGLAAAGDPVKRIEKSWHSFKHGYSTSSGESRLVSGLGSNRYDFYRVALDQFAAHPVAGIGVDNYQQQYLAHGRSSETPRYPHSVELRTLTETGVLGAVLALAGLLGAGLTALRGTRGRDPLAAAVAAAALGGFGYWLVHGSVDWFWEFAGLGAPAFALLGLACALAPAPEPGEGLRQARAPFPRRVEPPGRAAGLAARAARPAAIAAGALLALAAAASLALPWFSQLEVQSAARVWTRAPATAYSRLDDAAGLNPLSDEAYLVAGSIALRYGELTHADSYFRRALQRTPDDAYATLERGAIASTRGQRRVALRLLERAVRLAPREGLGREALALARAGRPVSVYALNRAILLKARQLA
jgi:tetratricopeptide (TPR) repeat protein